MTPVLWIGAFAAREAFEPSFAAAGLELLVVPDVDRALGVAAGRSIPVAFVSVDVGRDRVAAEIERLRAALPNLEVVAVTAGTADPLALAALRAGARDLVALQSASPASVVDRAGAALGRYLAGVRDADFLREVLDLADEMLRTAYELERRNLAGEEDRTAGDGAPYRILVIDDEPTICRMFEMMLDGKGYEIRTVGTAEEGLELFHERPFQLVVTDKNLPGMSGLEVLKTLKRLRPATDVVLITGFASKQSAEEALANGAAAYLEKPFDDLAGVEGTLEVLIQKQRLNLQHRRGLEVFKQRHRELLRRYARIRAALQERLRSGGA